MNDVQSAIRNCAISMWILLIVVWISLFNGLQLRRTISDIESDYIRFLIMTQASDVEVTFPCDSSLHSKLNEENKLKRSWIPSKTCTIDVPIISGNFTFDTIFRSLESNIVPTYIDWSKQHGKAVSVSESVADLVDRSTVAITVETTPQTLKWLQAASMSAGIHTITFGFLLTPLLVNAQGIEILYFHATNISELGRGMLNPLIPQLQSSILFERLDKQGKFNVPKNDNFLTSGEDKEDVISNSASITYLLAKAGFATDGPLPMAIDRALWQIQLQKLKVPGLELEIDLGSAATASMAIATLLGAWNYWNLLQLFRARHQLFAERRKSAPTFIESIRAIRLLRRKGWGPRLTSIPSLVAMNSLQAMVPLLPLVVTAGCVLLISLPSTPTGSLRLSNFPLIGAETRWIQLTFWLGLILLQFAIAIASTSQYARLLRFAWTQYGLHRGATR